MGFERTKDPQDVRSKQVKLLFTPAEHALLERLAAARRTTIAAFIRGRLDQSLQRQAELDALRPAG